MRPDMLPGSHNDTLGRVRLTDRVPKIRVLEHFHVPETQLRITSRSEATVLYCDCDTPKLPLETESPINLIASSLLKTTPPFSAALTILSDR